nr:hypothetical protein [Tanacetum cinerariifolium]
MPNPEDITDPTTAMNMALVLMAKAFKLNYSSPTNNNQGISSNPHNNQIAQLGCLEPGIMQYNASTMLIFFHAPLFLWAEVIATACYTQNRSIIHRRFNKTPYELINGKKPDISFLHVFGDLCYPKNDRKDIRKPGAKVADNVLNVVFDGNKFVNLFATPSTSAAESSSSQYMDPSNMYTFYQPCPYKYQHTKDHPQEQVIGEPSQPVLTRNQLRSDGDICMYALTVSTIEPKNVKEAMTDPAWIESMQEELLQLKRLDNGSYQDIYAAHKAFTVFSMNVKTTFLHGTLKEDMYICQPEGFIDVDYPSHVYKLKKALYGLKASTKDMPLRNVDDGGMTYFLGLQVNRSSCGIFINQSNYVLEILKKYGMETCDRLGTLMEIKEKLDQDQYGTPLDAMKYRSMIGALWYLTSSRPDIVHATCYVFGTRLRQPRSTSKRLKGSFVISEEPSIWVSGIRRILVLN